MMIYKAPSPKRTRLYSNSMAVKLFGVGKLSANYMRNKTRVRTTTKRVNKDGKTQFSGSTQLKGTQSHSQLLLQLCSDRFWCSLL